LDGTWNLDIYLEFDIRDLIFGVGASDESRLPQNKNPWSLTKGFGNSFG